MPFHHCHQSIQSHSLHFSRCFTTHITTLQYSQNSVHCMFICYQILTSCLCPDHRPRTPELPHRSSISTSATWHQNTVSPGPHWHGPRPSGIPTALPIPNGKRAALLSMDIDSDGSLKTSMMVFPDAVVKTMKAGWMKHIHLDMLTAAFAEHELLKPSSSTSIIRTNADGTLEASEKSHPSDKERNMDFQEWCGAYIRHIHLIRLYYPGADRDEIADAFNLHFSTLRDDPTAPKMWEVFLDYDVRIRRTFVSHGILPKDFQPNFFRQAQQEWLINKTNSIPATNSSSRYHPYDRSTFDRHPSSFRNDRPPPKTYNKGQYTDSFRAKPDTGRLFCIFCGFTGHPSRECSNRKPYLIQNDRQEWVGPDTRQICYKWNGNPAACSGCARAHICTLCGKDHHARSCRLARV